MEVLNIGCVNFKVAFEDGDYDYYYATTKWTRVDKQSLNRIREYIKDNSYDYICTEYDCNGSTREIYKLKVHKIGNDCYKIKVKYNWSKD